MSVEKEQEIKVSLAGINGETRAQSERFIKDYLNKPLACYIHEWDPRSNSLSVWAFYRDKWFIQRCLNLDLIERGLFPMRKGHG